MDTESRIANDSSQSAGTDEGMIRYDDSRQWMIAPQKYVITLLTLKYKSNALQCSADFATR
jgi:hypothetical protein